MNEQNTQPSGSAVNVLVVGVDTLEAISLHLDFNHDSITVVGSGGGALGLLDHNMFDRIVIGPTVVGISPDELFSDIQQLCPRQKILTAGEFVRCFNAR